MQEKKSDWAYFDYAATTPIDPEIARFFYQTLLDEQGNSGSAHTLGRAIKERIEVARAHFAQLIGAKEKEIVFTSGATEANNLAIKGACTYHAVKKPRVISIKTEHKAVIDPIGILAKQGVESVFLDVDSNGLIDLNALENALKEKPSTLVSVMAVNNETGVMQDVQAIAKLSHQYGAKLHIDAAQALGKIPLNIEDIDCDMMSFSGHKIYAPQGIGALYVRHFPKMRIQAQQHGGGQERGYRSGTLPSALIQSFVQGAIQLTRHIPENLDVVRQLKAQLKKNLPATMSFNIDENAPVLPHIVNIDMGKNSAQALILADKAKIVLSAGSACQAGDKEGSHVLKAMGKNPHHSLRVSLSHLTSEQEMIRLLNFFHDL